MQKQRWIYTTFLIFIIAFLCVSINCKKQKDENIQVKCVRLYADASGESHFEDIEIDLKSTDYAPPAPNLYVSEFSPAESYGFLYAPPGWYGDWHPAPKKQLFLYLSGEIEVTASDGEIRRFRSGSITIAEDTTGRGHTSRVVGSEDALLAIVPIKN